MKAGSHSRDSKGLFPLGSALQTHQLLPPCLVDFPLPCRGQSAALGVPTRAGPSHRRSAALDPAPVLPFSPACGRHRRLRSGLKLDPVSEGQCVNTRRAPRAHGRGRRRAARAAPRPRAPARLLAPGTICRAAASLSAFPVGSANWSRRHRGGLLLNFLDRNRSVVAACGSPPPPTAVISAGNLLVVGTVPLLTLGSDSDFTPAVQDGVSSVVSGR